MNVLLALSHAIDRINKGFGVLCDWLVLIVVLISAGNAASRYLFNLTSNAFMEVQWQIFGMIILLGASWTLCRNEHVRVDVFYSGLTPRRRLMVDTFGICLFLLPAMIILSVLSWQYFTTSYAIGEVSSSPGGLPFWPIKFVLPFGFALVAVQAVSELIKRIAALMGLIDLDTHYEKLEQ